MGVDYVYISNNREYGQMNGAFWEILWKSS